MNCITVSVSECFNKMLKIHIPLDVNSFNVLNFFRVGGWGMRGCWLLMHHCYV